MIHLPADEAARWELHRERTNAAIAKVEEMQGAGDATEAVIGKYLADMLASDAARIELIAELPPAAPVPTSFARDILPLFRPKDIDHMDNFGVILDVYEKVDQRRDDILARLQSPDDFDVMPKPPDPRWTAPQIELFRRWIAERRPR